jgi:hypothetical protein
MQRDSTDSATAHTLAQSVDAYATSHKIAGSNPDEVTTIFSRAIHSSLNITRGSTQPLP